jgi:hypothetical protein
MQYLPSSRILTQGIKVHAYLALGLKTYAYLALGCSQFCISYLCILWKYISYVFIHIGGFLLTIKLWPNSVVCWKWHVFKESRLTRKRPMQPMKKSRWPKKNPRHPRKKVMSPMKKPRQLRKNPRHPRKKLMQPMKKPKQFRKMLRHPRKKPITLGLPPLCLVIKSKFDHHMFGN